MPLISLLYKGKKYQDPIDGNTFSKLLPYGYKKIRKNVLSPTTLSLERHRLIWLYLKKETQFFSERLKVLHIAPEQIFYKRFKKLKNLEYTTTDLNSPLADVKADITNLPFKGDSFNVVFCNHVLEHIPNDRKAMKELFRVMKKDSWGIFQVPLEKDRKITFEDERITSKKDRIKYFGQYDHVRIYGIDYLDRLKDTGFYVEAIAYCDTLTPEEISKYVLDKHEFLVLCRKK